MLWEHQELSLEQKKQIALESFIDFLEGNDYIYQEKNKIIIEIKEQE